MVIINSVLKDPVECSQENAWEVHSYNVSPQLRDLFWWSWERTVAAHSSLTCNISRT